MELKKKLLEYSKKLKNNNFTFLDSVSKEKVFSFIEISNYSIINLKKSNDFKNVIPSKIFENVALYKPVLLGVEGESKKLIENYNVGIAYEPENSKSFLKAISEVQNLNKKLFKKNCDKMINDFDRNKIAEELIKFIKS